MGATRRVGARAPAVGLRRAVGRAAPSNGHPYAYATATANGDRARDGQRHACSDGDKQRHARPNGDRDGHGGPDRYTLADGHGYGDATPTLDKHARPAVDGRGHLAGHDPG